MWTHSTRRPPYPISFGRQGDSVNKLYPRLARAVRTSFHHRVTNSTSVSPGGVEMRLKAMGRRVIGLMACAAATGGTAVVTRADDPGDETPVYEVEGTTVMSAVKLPVPLDEVGAAITVLDREELRATPAQSVPEILSSGAGLHTYDFAGTGMASSAESRGFAAQRETSHLQFLLDGLPFMDFADDNALWNLFDLDQLDRIEVLRSSSSALHGNTAFTGVVNLVPFTARDRFSAVARVGGGTNGRFDLTQVAGWRTDAWSGSLTGRWRRVDGWREHSAWTGGSAYGSARLPLGVNGKAPEAQLAVLFGASDADLPGPLPRNVLDADPTTAVTPFDHDDMTRVHAVAAMSSSPRADNPYRLSLQVSHEDRSTIETILDTQEESRVATVLGGQATWRVGLVDRGVSAGVLVGVEGSLGTIGFRVSGGGRGGDGGI